MRNFLLDQTGILDGLPHGNRGVGSGIAHETQILFVNLFLQVDLGETAKVRSQTYCMIGLMVMNAGPAFPQGRKNRCQGIAQR